MKDSEILRYVELRIQTTRRVLNTGINSLKCEGKLSAYRDIARFINERAEGEKHENNS